ncbi:GNAT family N-acetyltransferase [Streptomyces mangrovisoli]|uniref:GNAT family N-acetyltransferase n=1 Tax=Streptomyces mangrovisoli TaxID=1428628 RepID=A0A1J4NJL8_9ACTN|nr:GNAT family N-acetyltransferase [Streptomyces mangrovisoli]OIJ62577.1 GNAT family N-acetyltransferase [Streptomyces mangrovisoli]
MSLLVRPAALDDAPAVTALLNEIDRIEIGQPETDLHTVRADLTKAGIDLSRDSWLGFEGERLVAYGLLWDDSGGERIDVDHYVLPDHQAAGARILDALRDRAREKAGAGRAVAHLHLNSVPTLDTTLLKDRGWSVVRRYHVLTRTLSPAGDAVPEPSAGVRVRSCEDEADRLRVHALHQASFAEHFGFQRRTYEQWLDDVDADHLDWSLVWIAAADGLGDTGFLLARDDREAMGWIRSLGVLREARGRGVGGLLLRQAFAAFTARGRDTVGLGVDTANPTGAPQLYARSGMSLHYAVDTWETALR